MKPKMINVNSDMPLPKEGGGITLSRSGFALVPADRLVASYVSTVRYIEQLQQANENLATLLRDNGVDVAALYVSEDS